MPCDCNWKPCMLLAMVLGLVVVGLLVLRCHESHESHERHTHGPGKEKKKGAGAGGKAEAEDKPEDKEAEDEAGAEAGAEANQSLQYGTDADIDTVLNSPDPVVVFAFADWCGHSNMTLPAIQKAAAMTTGTKFVGLDVKHAPKFMDMYQVMGYPTILKFDRGQVIGKYEGDRTAESFAQFAS